MMSTQFHCDDTATLVAFVYDDIEPLEKAAVSRHLVECARCRDEVAALGGVRQALGAWSPPVPELRFTVVPESAVSNVVRPHVPAWQTVPRWAQLVAATLALAVGASVANVQVRHDATGWTITTGWMAPAAPAQTVAAPTGVDARQFQMAMTALEQSLHNHHRSTFSNSTTLSDFLPRLVRARLLSCRNKVSRRNWSRFPTT